MRPYIRPKSTTGTVRLSMISSRISGPIGYLSKTCLEFKPAINVELDQRFIPSQGLLIVQCIAEKMVDDHNIVQYSEFRQVVSVGAGADMPNSYPVRAALAEVHVFCTDRVHFGRWNGEGWFDK